MYREPEGPGIRIDSGVQEGSEISIHYDPMVAKVITSGATRKQALDRMENALDRWGRAGLAVVCCKEQGVDVAEHAARQVVIRVGMHWTGAPGMTWVGATMTESARDRWVQSQP